jgi:hypothetical protein
MKSQYVGYAWEQLFGAVSSLASSPLPLRERLLDAVVSRAHRIFPSVSTDKLPAEIDERLGNLERALTEHGSFQESIERMEDREVEHAIDEIVGLFSMVARAYPEI